VADFSTGFGTHNCNGFAKHYWSAEDLWRTQVQLTEAAFRIEKSDLRIKKSFSIRSRQVFQKEICENQCTENRKISASAVV